MATEPIPNPNEKLLKVFDAEQDSEVMVVRGLLEAEGIDCQTTAVDIPQDVMPLGGVMLLVREEDAPRALQIIEEYRREPGEESEEDFTEESQSE